MSMAGRIYGGVITSLAVVAGLVIWAIIIAIVLDVGARNLRLPGARHTYAFIEYGLLLVTILASPWLIREKGHIYVEIVFQALPTGVQRWLATLIYFLCAFACLLVAVYSFGEVLSAYRRGVMETRSFDIPRWIPMAVFPFGFLLMSVEFSRCLLGFNSLYSDVNSRKLRGDP